MGPCGYNARNNRGDWSIHIAQSYNLKTDNIFFKKFQKASGLVAPQKCHKKINQPLTNREN